MNKKLIFRVLGALASALIIISVFVPFVSVTGYTTSLWESFELANSLYLPIMIMVFGAIGVIFFSLNIKTEFAYMSTGAIIFFLVIQTIDVLNQGVFNTLSLGYYFLAVGALLTGIMAFLTNLKSNKKLESIEPITPSVQPTMLDQIDKLYNDQPMNQNEISPIQPVDTIIEPISIQPLQDVAAAQTISVVEQQVSVEEPVVQTMEPQSVLQTSPVINEQPVLEVNPFETVTPQPVEQQVSVEEPVVQTMEPQQVLQTSPVINEQPVIEVNPFETVTPQPVEQQVSVEEPVVQTMEPQPVLQTSPVINEQPVLEVNPFETVTPQPVEQQVSVEEPVVQTVEPQPFNPVVQEFTQSQINPVIQEFTNPEFTSTPVVQEFSTPAVNPQPTDIPVVNEPVPVNPVVQEFTNPTLSMEPQFQSNELDIFGQPINK